MSIINVQSIDEILKTEKCENDRLKDIFSKAKELKGLSANEVACLTLINDAEMLEELFATAQYIKNSIYGRRLVLFAPLYISNLCANECLYCAFRAGNKSVHRRVLSQSEIANEIKILEEQGHKRVLLVAGESYPEEGFKYVLDSIETIYKTKNGHNEIRRVNVNIAPLSVDQFKQLKKSAIGTYQLFQETYDRDVYSKVHTAGKKSDYEWRLTAMDRAMEAGIDDVGIGVLFGLADWRFETLALMQHINHLDSKFGVGPHTISVPRLEPATGSEISVHPPVPVDDITFKKIVAILPVLVIFLRFARVVTV